MSKKSVVKWLVGTAGAVGGGVLLGKLVDVVSEKLSGRKAKEEEENDGDIEELGELELDDDDEDEEE